MVALLLWSPDPRRLQALQERQGGVPSHQSHDESYSSGTHNSTDYRIITELVQRKIQNNIILHEKKTYTPTTITCPRPRSAQVN